MPEFREWLKQKYRLAGPVTEEEARNVVCRLCGVESRGHIDGHAAAEGQFQYQIRGPWSKHYQAVNA